ncbi:hypothetical protein BCAR13_710098 [Paraburkholderia caribensis]|nr:hypothetical protein BCAR13_710098 [Paraburkholderia caribensis]
MGKSEDLFTIALRLTVRPASVHGMKGLRTGADALLCVRDDAPRASFQCESPLRRKC